jgi:hypothetical protein
MLEPMSSSPVAPQGTGLGLRRDFLAQVLSQPPEGIDFYEVAPENWMRTGGRLGRQFRAFTEQHRVIAHGLSLSIGSVAPLDEAFVREVRDFLRQHELLLYSEHLSYCSDNGHLYDLLPIPFTEHAVAHVVERIQRVQDILGQRLVLENSSYYAAPDAEMDELSFLQAVLRGADCQLLLDVNNVYVNSVNHGYDAYQFLDALPAERVAYIHVAGHYHEAQDLIVDTHGADVSDPVWDLLAHTYQRLGPVATLLERDFNIPPLEELLHETQTIQCLQRQHTPLDWAHSPA